MSKLKKTPLGEIHVALGAKMVDFAGFSMPVTYGSIIGEHQAVRERVGLFDVSHMGEIMITGDGAKDFVNGIITNDCSSLSPGALQYTVMCRDDGTVVDDLLVYVLSDDRILLVINASNIDKDVAHVRSFESNGVEVRNVSDDYALLAVQGPNAGKVLNACSFLSDVRERFETTEYYNGFQFVHEGAEVLVSRTGYTGEFGYEIFVPPHLARSLWEGLMRAGEAHGVQPIGLGARDTLRFEASYCLYGHEIDDETSPLEAGLGWVVKLKKERFSGLDTLRTEKKNGSSRTLVGFELEGRNIARQGYSITRDGMVIGKVTSGAFSPTLQKSLCMALIQTSAKENEADYEVQIRNKSVSAEVTRLPFYKSRAK